MGNENPSRVGLYAVVVDAKHDKAKAFYTKLGFIACVWIVRWRCICRWLRWNRLVLLDWV